jgi:NADPH-dependent 2,4-dienoyl-CoA reductase/sulfur reductase-like enzyme
LWQSLLLDNPVGKFKGRLLKFNFGNVSMNSNESEGWVQFMLQKIVIVGAGSAGLLLAHYLPIIYCIGASIA